ncbi:Factor arrest protein 11 [Dimargaris cristalligena]|nr:Factor arrest protein 11 [Dimargaris cristalligena]
MALGLASATTAISHPPPEQRHYRHDTEPSSTRSKSDAKSKKKKKKWNFHYDDNDALSNALTDYYSYLETPKFDTNYRNYAQHPDRPTSPWMNTPYPEQERFVRRLIHLIDEAPTTAALFYHIRTLLYIAQGCFRDLPFSPDVYQVPDADNESKRQSTVHSDPLHLYWIEQNARLMWKCDLLAYAYQRLVAIAEHMLSRYKLPESATPTTPGTPQSSRSTSQQDPWRVVTSESELGLWLDILFMLIEVHCENKEFGDQVRALEPSFPSTLLLLAQPVDAFYSDHLVIKKYLLVTRRCLVTVFGGTDQSDLKSRLKALYSECDRAATPQLKCDVVQSYQFYATHTRSYPTFYDMAKEPLNGLLTTLRDTDLRVPGPLGHPDVDLCAPRAHYHNLLAQDRSYLEELGNPDSPAEYPFPIPPHGQLIPTWLSEADGLHRRGLYTSPSQRQYLEVCRDFSQVAPADFWSIGNTPGYHRHWKIRPVGYGRRDKLEHSTDLDNSSTAQFGYARELLRRDHGPVPAATLPGGESPEAEAAQARRFITHLPNPAAHQRFGRRNPWVLLYSDEIDADATPHAGARSGTEGGGRNENVNKEESELDETKRCRARIKCIHECYNTTALHLTGIVDVLHSWTLTSFNYTKLPSSNAIIAEPTETPFCYHHRYGEVENPDPFSGDSPMYATRQRRRYSLPALENEYGDPTLDSVLGASPADIPTNLSTSMPTSWTMARESGGGGYSMPPSSSSTAAAAAAAGRGGPPNQNWGSSHRNSHGNSIDPLLHHLIHALRMNQPDNISLVRFMQQRDMRVRVMAIQSILMVLTKGFKVDHVLRFEYLMQCLWDMGFTRTMFSWLCEKQIRYVEEREKLEDLGFTAYCSPQSNLWTVLTRLEMEGRGGGDYHPSSINSSLASDGGGGGGGGGESQPSESDYGRRSRLSQNSRRNSLAPSETSDVAVPISISPTPSQSSTWTNASTMGPSKPVTAMHSALHQGPGPGDRSTVPGGLVQNSEDEAMQSIMTVSGSPTPTFPLMLTIHLVEARAASTRTRSSRSTSIPTAGAAAMDPADGSRTPIDLTSASLHSPLPLGSTHTHHRTTTATVITAPTSTSTSAKRRPSRHVWCSQYTGVTMVRLIQKMTKNKPRRIDRLKTPKWVSILSNLTMVQIDLLKVYVYKIVKSLVPFMGRDWIHRNLDLISGVYLHVPPKLVDDWMRPFPASAPLIRQRDERFRRLLIYFNAQTVPWSYLVTNASSEPGVVRTNRAATTTISSPPPICTVYYSYLLALRLLNHPLPGDSVTNSQSDSNSSMGMSDYSDAETSLLSSPTGDLADRRTHGRGGGKTLDDVVDLPFDMSDTSDSNCEFYSTTDLAR